MTNEMVHRRDEEAVALAAELLRVDSTNGNETPVAEILAHHLDLTGVEVELISRDPRRANFVARIRGTGTGPSLAFVGHLDVVPADPRDWTHPPFAAVIDDEGYLWGRGAVDMKNEVAARAAAFASLARSGWQGSGDLLMIVVADEEDGSAEVGMNWLVTERPDLATTYAINEGGGMPGQLADGRRIADVSIGEKGTCPVILEAIGEAGHASTPTVGDNAVVVLAELIARLRRGAPDLADHPDVRSMVAAIVGTDSIGSLEAALDQASALLPEWETSMRSISGITMAPTVLHGSTARNVMPGRASVELDCRTLPGVDEHEVMAAVRRRLGEGPYELSLAEPPIHGNSSPATGALWEALGRYSVDVLDRSLIPTLCSGFTDSVYLRRTFGTVAYGFSPFQTTPYDVIESGFHNRDERVHVDDIALSASFHEWLARDLLGHTSAP